MRGFKLIFGAVVAAVAIACCEDASASVFLPQPHSDLWIQTDSTGARDIRTGPSAVQVTLGSGSMTASTVMSPTPTASVSVDRFPESGYTDALLIYQGVVEGPDEVNVPLHFAGHYASQSGGAPDHDAAWGRFYVSSISILPNGSEVGSIFSAGTGGCVDCNSLVTAPPGQLAVNDIDQVIDVETNLPFYIELEAFILWNEEATRSTAFAVADPHIFIDPAFPEASLFTLTLSPGVGNGPPPGVPEPEAWVLLTAGLGLAGGALRRRRRFGWAGA